MAIDRRTRFRDYMRRLDPTGDPVQAVASGFYVPPPNAVSRRIATRIELEPVSSHLLVGGIGSGKLPSSLRSSSDSPRSRICFPSGSMCPAVIDWKS